MGAVKKFKDNYPKENKAAEKQDSIKDKQMIEAYLKRIEELMKDPEKQKKAAQIISQLINSKK